MSGEGLADFVFTRVGIRFKSEIESLRRCPIPTHSLQLENGRQLADTPRYQRWLAVDAKPVPRSKSTYHLNGVEESICYSPHE